MKYLFFFLLLYSCGYPDIDSVPDFNDLQITKEESIDLCKFTYTDNKDLTKCLDKISLQDKK
jgi:hypothetical protein